MIKLIDLGVIAAVQGQLPAATDRAPPSYTVNIWGDMSFSAGNERAVPSDRPISDTLTFYKVPIHDSQGVRFWRWALKVET
jgi:hypothetical protein